MARIIGKDIYYSTEEVGKKLGVASRTVLRWFEVGYVVVRRESGDITVDLTCFTEPLNGYKYVHQRDVDRLEKMANSEREKSDIKS